MSQQMPPASNGPMSERTFWAWLMVVCGVACWLIAGVWAYRAQYEYDTGQAVYAAYSVGFFILGLGPLGVALAMWLRTALTRRQTKV